MLIVNICYMINIKKLGGVVLDFLNYKENNVVKDARIHMRVSSSQKQIIESLSKNRNMTVTEYILFLVNNDINNLKNKK